MGRRSKLLTSHTAIPLSESFVQKYKDDYYIDSSDNGTYYLNIASKYERKEHIEIIQDLEKIAQKESMNVFYVLLWEDGEVELHNALTWQFCTISL